MCEAPAAAGPNALPAREYQELYFGWARVLQAGASDHFPVEAVFTSRKIALWCARLNLSLSKRQEASKRSMSMLIPDSNAAL